MAAPKRCVNVGGGRLIPAEEMVKKIDNETRVEVDEAVKFADEAPYPDVGKMLEDVYAPLSEEV